MSNRQSSDNRCGCLFAKGTQTLTDKPKSSAKKKKAAPKDPAAEARKASKKLLKTIKTCLEDAKAEDVIAIDVGNKTSVADHMVIASGRSQRHVSAITDQLSRSLKKAGVKGAHSEGTPHCDWVLIDAGDVVVHLFRPEVRSFYNLEKLWSPQAPDEKIAV
ncbi:MAG: ribosome silencing factor [Pseudomonadota bacterium]